MNNFNNADLRVFTGTANPKLAAEVAKELEFELTPCKITSFADGETYVQIGETIRGADCYVIQPTCKPVNDNYMELFIMLDALKRASAERITVVMPYYGYARQDRKAAGHEAITAKLVATLLEAAGAKKVVALDLHAEQIEGFFTNATIDHLRANTVHLDHVRSLNLDNLVVVAPDVGGAKRARAFAKKLNDSPIAIIDKRRTAHNEMESLDVVGDIKGKTCLMVDDIIDTANTLIKGAQLLKDKGAERILACCTHPVLSNNAAAKIQASVIEQLITTNSIPEDPNNTCDKIVQLSLAPLLAQAIKRIHTNKSVSELFD